jgi:hypothetical protein
MPEADQDRWLTYAEVGQLLGISASAARMHAKRRGWQRRSPNAIGARAMVLVPPDATVRPHAGADRPPFVAHKVIEPNGADQVNVRAVSSAIAALREQLAIANERVARAELRAEADRARVDELQAALAEERRRVIEILTGSAHHSWWWRWFR